MCGRFTLTENPQVLRDVFDLSTPPQGMEPRYNIAPTQPVAVISNDDPRNLTYFRWGLVPSWSKDLSMGSKLINARSETAHEKPAFRAAFRRRRCIIPASGFFEWKQADGKKIPHYIHPLEDQIFGFAGLWEIWHSPDGDELRTCTILTTSANEFMSSLHDRMPVILPRELFEEWLQPGEQPLEVLIPMMKPYRPDAMTAYPVSTMVNRPGNDVPDVIQPVA
jgi:putative SOS response-associated peptidase YedK